MQRKILTIGAQLASDAAQFGEFRSKTSFLDWDIILFRPDIDSYLSRSGRYKGKPSLNDEESFALTEATEHWRREIKQAIETGKTVIVFLPPVSHVYVATGEKNYLGTGRSQQATRVVIPFTNYESLPFNLKPVNATGTGIKLTATGASTLTEYWKEMGEFSGYQVILNAEIENPSLITKSGDKAVGTVFKNATSPGSITFLPDIDFDRSEFTTFKGDQLIWTKKARQFAGQFLDAIIILDAKLRAGTSITPEPAWAKDKLYLMPVEASLHTELLEIEQQVNAAQRKKEDIQSAIKLAGQSRALLYEKGPPLEDAIMAALNLLGFTCSKYKSGESEFDVVFECPEGRLIGEVEGKDTKPINVEKLRQLAMNLSEDLQRDEVEGLAKGVLFGNGYRLSPPDTRDTQFTQKCITAAKQSNTALVTTEELFRAVQYLAERPDVEFASRCRASILDGSGIVKLPTPDPVNQVKENLKEIERSDD